MTGLSLKIAIPLLMITIGAMGFLMLQDEDNHTAFCQSKGFDYGTARSNYPPGIVCHKDTYLCPPERLIDSGFLSGCQKIDGTFEHFSYEEYYTYLDWEMD